MKFLNKGYSQAKVYALIIQRVFIWLSLVAFIIGFAFSNKPDEGFPDALLRQKFNFDVMQKQGPIRTKLMKMKSSQGHCDIILRNLTPRAKGNYFNLNVKIFNAQDQVINEFTRQMYKYGEDSDGDGLYHKVFKVKSKQQFYVQLEITKSYTKDWVLSERSKAMVELVVDDGANYLAEMAFFIVGIFSLLGMVIMLIVPRFMK
jgi:hypothetical protein